MIPLLAFLLAASAAMDKIPADQLRADLEIARQALAEGHPGAFRYSSKAEFERAFQQAAARIAGPLTAVEFMGILRPAVAVVKCGHTGVGFPADLGKQLQAELAVLPFDVEILERKVWIRRDFSPAAALAGAEILAINGRPIKSLLAQVEAAESGDGNIAVGRWGRLAGSGFARSVALIAGLKAPYQVTYRYAGKRNTAEFAGLTAAQHPAIPQGTSPWAELDFRDGGRIAIMTIRTFGGFADRERKVQLSDFMTDAFGQIRDNGSKVLLLDLRRNGGGRDALGKQLVAHLLDHDFDYYDALLINARTFSFAQYTERPPQFPDDKVRRRADGRFDWLDHPNVGRQKPALPHFAGQVIALSDRDSFSATGEFLTAFHSARRGTIVGEETGASYSGNTSGAGVTLVLPASKLRVNIPLMGYYLPMPRRSAPDRGVMPDVPVKVTIGDKLAGRDPILERALALARGQR